VKLRQPPGFGGGAIPIAEMIGRASFEFESFCQHFRLALLEQEIDEAAAKCRDNAHDLHRYGSDLPLGIQPARGDARESRDARSAKDEASLDPATKRCIVPQSLEDV
jgi:hypothetical protein